MHLESAPDIIIQIDDYVNSISGVVGYGKDFRERFGGHHRRDNGTFIAWGPNIKENFEIKAKMYDIAPTILDFLNVVRLKKQMQGTNIIPLLLGETDKIKDSAYLEYSSEKLLGN